MAQHISIKNSPLKNFQKIYKSICKNIKYTKEKTLW